MEVLMLVVGIIVGFAYGLGISEIINCRYENIQRIKKEEIEKKLLEVLKKEDSKTFFK
ncbi:MAG: hypothetical protein QW754_05645 [Thermoplasmata archaeon]